MDISSPTHVEAFGNFIFAQLSIVQQTGRQVLCSLQVTVGERGPCVSVRARQCARTETLFTVRHDQMSSASASVDRIMRGQI